MTPLSILPTGGKNGDPVLDYSDELYRRFKEALLGTGSPFISDERDTRDFVGKQGTAIAKNPREKFGHWMKSKEKIDLDPVRREDWGIKEVAYEATLKFAPPTDLKALGQCVEEFTQEFGLQSVSQEIYTEAEKASKRAVDAGRPFPVLSNLEQRRSRKAMQSTPGGSDGVIKIQIPETEFEKIRQHIVIPSGPMNAVNPK